MIAKIQKWGNSQGLRLSRQLLESAHLNVGDEVDVSEKGGKIVIAPTRKVRGRYKLDELLARIPKDYEAEELDWGGPAGKEVW